MSPNGMRSSLFPSEDTYPWQAVTEVYPFDRTPIEYLENILSAFRKSRQYVQLCRERRPTTEMPVMTVNIFIQTVELLTFLLDFDQSKETQASEYAASLKHTQGNRALRERSHKPSADSSCYRSIATDARCGQ